ncbi:ATP-binding cassette domain-containing protein [Candidatus Fermentibacteria bacterium]|nr:ATP-binding cassette domain-containing protein [Candidatus Fermentibacteria bacterium]
MNSAPSQGKPGSLSVHRLQKRFGDTLAVRELSLEVMPGSVHGLLGPNGAGKTTTLRTVMGILRADGGTILRDEAPMDRHAVFRTGYLPEERGLYPRMTVADQLAFFAALRRMPRHAIKERVAYWLGFLGLTPLARRRTDELSMGLQQLLQVAVALVHEPDLVVLDEPFTGLDPLHVARLMELLADLRARGRAVLLSTHAMERAEEICDHVTFLDHGTVAAEGSIDTLRHSVGHRVVKVVFRAPVPALPIQGMDATVVGTTVTVRWSSPDDPLDFIRGLAAAGEIVEVELRPASLRDIFMRVIR